MGSETAFNSSYFNHNQIRMIDQYDCNMVSSSSNNSENNMWMNSASNTSSGGNDTMPDRNNNRTNNVNSINCSSNNSNSSINSGTSSNNSNVKPSSSSSSITSSHSSSSNSISNSNNNNNNNNNENENSHCVSNNNNNNNNNQSNNVPGNIHHTQNMSWNLVSVPPPPTNSSLYNHHHHHHHHHPSFQRAYPDSRYLNGSSGLNFMDSASLNNHHLLTLSHSNSGINQTYKRYFQTGKSGNSKDLCGDDKHKEDGDPWSVDAPAAFLGPNLWDRTLPYEADLKVHPYVDLDEFLSENCIPSVDGLQNSHLTHATSLGHRSSDSLSHGPGLSLGLNQITKRERSPSPSDCMSPDTINPPSPADSTFSMASTGREFDPRTRAFSDEELKPQPMIKKSRKQFVPDELKDDKYWARRRKNNMAAKRSRDARRMKENQIALRAGFLEKENMSLHRELEQLKQENMELRARLSKYQEV